MKYSVSSKLFWIILGTISIILCIAWFVIGSYSSQYYKQKKLNQMISFSDEIIQILDSEDKLQDKLTEINYKTHEESFDVFILDHDRNVIFASRFNDLIGPRIKQAPLYISDGRWKIPGPEPKWSRGLEFVIHREALPDGNELILLEGVQSIDDAVKIIRELFLKIILFALLLSMVAAYILSRNITRPLRKLNTIASEMGNLNFSLKYSEGRKDEIGQLGHTLNHLTEELEQTISKLKMELEKEKSLDKLRKQFVAQVSHELQTPISVLKGYIEALQDNLPETEEEKEYYFDIIENECKKMSKLVKDLLDLTQLESGTYSMNKKVFDIGSMLMRIFNKYKEISKGKDIKFGSQGMKENLFIFGDMGRLEQVVENLIQNAFKHTDENGEVSMVLEEDETEITVRIINTGEAIPDEDLPLIWESFYKARNKKKISGTGLGLAISKHILNMHHCRFGAHNLQGGVGFSFSISRYK